MPYWNNLCLDLTVPISHVCLKGLLSSDRRLSFAHQFSSSCVYMGEGVRCLWNILFEHREGWGNSCQKARTCSFPERKLLAGQPALAASAQQLCCPVIRKHGQPDSTVVDFPNCPCCGLRSLRIPYLKEKKKSTFPVPPLWQEEIITKQIESSKTNFWVFWKWILRELNYVFFGGVL